jgi:hypothetical protein
MHVIIYEAFNASGGITVPASSTTTETPQEQPAVSGFLARVKADVTAGLNIRSSMDTSSPKNIIASVPAGTLLGVLNADDYAKVGGVNQWVRVRDSKGHEGFCAAWYLEKVSQAATPSTVTTTPVSTSPQETPAVTVPQLVVAVASRVGKFGANVYTTASEKSAVVSTEKVRAKLFVIEDEKAAQKKIGKAGKWLNVQTKSGQKGFVKADLVGLVE